MRRLLKLMTQCFFMLCVLLAVLPTHIHAHPHNWITLKTEFTLNENGQLAELLQHWTFDVYYSAIRLADIDNEYKDQQQGLDELANEMAKNLKHYKYFSELKIDNQLLNLGKPNYHSLAITFDESQQQLILTMGFTLKALPSIEGKKLSWRVFDPTYYIDMRHQKTSQVLIHKNVGIKCSTHIESPRPSAEIVNYATGLDRSQKDTQGLGNYFAEEVLIHCL